MEGDADGRAARPRTGTAYAAGGAALVAVGVLVALLGDRTSLPPRLILLIAVGTSVIGLLVGYGLGFYVDRRGRSGR